MEKAINDRIMSFIDGRNSILSQNQYAYRKDKSIQDILYEITEEIRTATEENEISIPRRKKSIRFGPA